MGWWDKPAIVVANKQKLRLGRAKYTSTIREESMAVAQVWHYRGMRGNDRRSIDWSTGDYTHTRTCIIRVYDPSEEDSTKQGGALHSGEKAS